MVTSKDIAVVVPVISRDLSESEKLSLRQCVTVLGAYDIVILKPMSLDDGFLRNIYKITLEESFPDECFSSIRSYNKLVLSEDFYRRFASYKFILIYQLDAFVFRDELLKWANKGYDYVGAPWLPYHKSCLLFFGRTFLFACRALGLRGWPFSSFMRYQIKYSFNVGNGGFCLRRVSKMREIVSHYSDMIKTVMSDDKPFFPEDAFLSVGLRDRHFRLKRPGYKEAISFAFEENATWAFSHNGRRLPFGCHAWSSDTYYNEFWKNYISL